MIIIKLSLMEASYGVFDPLRFAMEVVVWRRSYTDSRKASWNWK